jgi:hypothetical protein
MTPLDILYTPLDLPEMPNVDMVKLRNWIDQHKNKQKIEPSVDDKDKVGKNYPWDIIHVRHNHAWFENFDNEFPELAKYSTEGFGLDLNNVLGITLLPIKNSFKGLGFWHSDFDETGLRYYIENNETRNFLYISPSTDPYMNSEELHSGRSFQNIRYSAKLLKSNQAFFINNVRSCHAVNSTNLSPSRIAVIVTINGSITDHPLADLIVQSAEKFSEYSILWTPPK